jgi:hypothetical protein
VRRSSWSPAAPPIGVGTNYLPPIGVKFRHPPPIFGNAPRPTPPSVQDTAPPDGNNRAGRLAGAVMDVQRLH